MWHTIIFLVIGIGVILWIIKKTFFRNKKAFYKNPNQQLLYADIEKLTAYSIILIGDAGLPEIYKEDKVMQMLAWHVNKQGAQGSVVFLGDNIYPKGMPPEGHESRDIAEKRINVQLDVVKNYAGNVFFISGNHDWNKGRKGGYEAVLREEAYIEAYLNRKDVYLPAKGCLGPVEVSVNPTITMVFINTQWWIQRGERPLGEAYNCADEAEESFFTNLDLLLAKLYQEKKQVVLIGHHPLYSYALHGGKFLMKQHVFPLTALHKRLYLPLPLAGSIYPFYRKYFGAREDMSHPKYKYFRKKLIHVLEKYKNLLYACGHEHNLQYIVKHTQHYIVSGSGSKTAFVRKGSGVEFAHEHKGFFKLIFLKNGAVILEAWEINDINQEGTLAYYKEIKIK